MFNLSKLRDVILPLFFGLLGALFLQFFFIHPNQQIATIDITQMIDSFVKETAKQKLTPDEMKQKVNQFGITLNSTLQTLSRKKHLILLPKEAVIAGSPDFTNELREKIKQGLKS